MTPDELINEIFAIQQTRNPDADPGDITIDIQDDTPLVMVRQDRGPTNNRFGPDFAKNIILAQGTPGHSIQEALENFLQEVKDGTR